MMIAIIISTVKMLALLIGTPKYEYRHISVARITDIYIVLTKATIGNDDPSILKVSSLESVAT
jgi:hypothetical protein